MLVQRHRLAILIVLFALLGWMGIALIDDSSVLMTYVGQRLGDDPWMLYFALRDFLFCRRGELPLP